MNDISLEQLQKELKPWSRHNFGNRPSWQPLLGLSEEVGELAHHFLKQAQGIRLNENHREEMKDAVADILIFLADFCNAEDINMQDELNKVWPQVRKRDFKKSTTGDNIRASKPFRQVMILKCNHSWVKPNSVGGVLKEYKTTGMLEVEVTGYNAKGEEKKLIIPVFSGEYKELEQEVINNA